MSPALKLLLFSLIFQFIVKFSPRSVNWWAFLANSHDFERCGCLVHDRWKDILFFNSWDVPPMYLFLAPFSASISASWIVSLVLQFLSMDASGIGHAELVQLHSFGVGGFMLFKTLLLFLFMI